MKLKNYKFILWDWNGTLLDDVDAGVAIINGMLSKRKMKTIGGKDDYRKLFRFPVSDYYKKVGFDFKKESFEVLSEEYIAAYNKQELKLFPFVKQTLAAVKEKNITQLILSASERTLLKKQVKQLGLDGFFTDFITLDNIYAAGKTASAQQWLSKSAVNPQDVLIVGDTLHDLDVARTIGCDCILIDGGHQDLSAAKASGATVVNSVTKVLNYH